MDEEGIVTAAAFVLFAGVIVAFAVVIADISDNMPSDQLGKEVCASKGLEYIEYHGQAKGLECARPLNESRESFQIGGLVVWVDG